MPLGNVKCWVGKIRIGWEYKSVCIWKRCTEAFAVLNVGSVTKVIH